MNKKYILNNALTLNITRNSFHAEAVPIYETELKLHKKHFKFDFTILAKEGKIIYKIYKINEPDIIQGLVAFLPAKGVLDCYNMEASKLNRPPSLMYKNLGKLMLSLCCKISFDYGLDGYITFESKNNLMNYYRRFGATNTFGLRMGINNISAQKLVSLYF